MTSYWTHTSEEFKMWRLGRFGMIRELGAVLFVAAALYAESDVTLSGSAALLTQ
jgi:hypothetical protein